MVQQGHINVTIDFQHWDAAAYDLRIPVHQPVKQLLINLCDTLNINREISDHFAVKVTTKNLLLVDDDVLTDYPVTDGDVLVVL